MLTWKGNKVTIQPAASVKAGDVKQAKRLEHKVSSRGVNMVLLEWNGRRDWYVDNYTDEQRSVEARHWRRERETKAREHTRRVDTLIAELEVLFR